MVGAGSETALEGEGGHGILPVRRGRAAHPPPGTSKDARAYVPTRRSVTSEADSGAEDAVAGGDCGYETEGEDVGDPEDQVTPQGLAQTAGLGRALEGNGPALPPHLEHLRRARGDPSPLHDEAHRRKGPGGKDWRR